MNYLADTHILLWAIRDDPNADDAPRVHRDPFDRLLLAQAKSEQIFFMTHDERIPYYNEACIVSV